MGRCLSASGTGRRVLVALAFAVSLGVAPGLACAYGGPPAAPVSGIDMLEDALGWMGALSGEGFYDPTEIVARMEHEAAQFFDLEFLAYQTVGPIYLQMNLLERAHLHNRIRDYLFEYLAWRFGLFGTAPPGVTPLMPQPSGLAGFVIGADVYHRGGPALRVLFHMDLTPDGWRIRDVTTNGRSVIVDMRLAFTGFGLPPWRPW